MRSGNQHTREGGAYLRYLLSMGFGGGGGGAFSDAFFAAAAAASFAFVRAMLFYLCTVVPAGDAAGGGDSW